MTWNERLQSWVFLAMGILCIATALVPAKAQNVNDATQTGINSSPILDLNRGLNINDLMRVSEQLENSQNRPTAEQQNRVLDSAIIKFNQSRQLKIGPNILAPATPTP